MYHCVGDAEGMAHWVQRDELLISGSDDGFPVEVELFHNSWLKVVVVLAKYRVLQFDK